MLSAVVVKRAELCHIHLRMISLVDVKNNPQSEAFVLKRGKKFQMVFQSSRILFSGSYDDNVMDLF